MRLLIDGDACPQREDIARIAKEYHMEMIVFTDYAHFIESDHYQVKICEIGKDSVDFMLISYVQQGDLVITQDYGLASLALSKGAKVLHVTGMIIHHDNIESLLMRRYEGYKQRKQDKHLKGPKKRTKEDQIFFMNQLMKIIKDER